MIDHTGVNVSNLARALAFYEAALAPLGYHVHTRIGDVACGFAAARDVLPGSDPGGDFWISQGQVQTPRVHIAFRAQSNEEVVAFYQAAIAAGGTDHGKPGYRAQYHESYFAAFVLDPDGHNIEAVCHQGIKN